MEQPAENPQQPPEESIFNDVDLDMRLYEKHIRRARIMLFIIAALQLIPIFTFDDSDPLVYQISVGLQIFIALAFAGMAFWTKYKPYAALITAMVFYVAIVLTAAIFEPSTLIQGALIKVIIIVLLARGIDNAKDARDMKRTFNR